MSDWVTKQEKTLKRWVNTKVSVEVKDLHTDLLDGLVLVELINGIADASISPNSYLLSPVYAKPIHRLQKYENVNDCLEFLKIILQINICNISADDIVGGNLKLILGLVWSIIVYATTNSLSKALSNHCNSFNKIKVILRDWINPIIRRKGLPEVTNFDRDWSLENKRPDLSLGAILEYYLGSTLGLISYAEMTYGKKLQNLRKVLDAANTLGIPRLADAEDFISFAPDEKCVITYLLEWLKLLELDVKQLTEREDTPDEPSSPKMVDNYSVFVKEAEPEPQHLERRESHNKRYGIIIQETTVDRPRSDDIVNIDILSPTRSVSTPRSRTEFEKPFELVVEDQPRKSDDTLKDAVINQEEEKPTIPKEAIPTSTSSLLDPISSNGRRSLEPPKVEISSPKIKSEEPQQVKPIPLQQVMNLPKDSNIPKLTKAPRKVIKLRVPPMRSAISKQVKALEHEYPKNDKSSSESSNFVLNTQTPIEAKTSIKEPFEDYDYEIGTTSFKQVNKVSEGANTIEKVSPTSDIVHQLKEIETTTSGSEETEIPPITDELEVEQQVSEIQDYSEKEAEEPTKQAITQMVDQQLKVPVLKPVLCLENKKPSLKSTPLQRSAGVLQKIQALEEHARAMEQSHSIPFTTKEPKLFKKKPEQYINSSKDSSLKLDTKPVTLDSGITVFVKRNNEPEPSPDSEVDHVKDSQLESKDSSRLTMIPSDSLDEESKDAEIEIPNVSESVDTPESPEQVENLSDNQIQAVVVAETSLVHGPVVVDQPVPRTPENIVEFADQSDESIINSETTHEDHRDGNEEATQQIMIESGLASGCNDTEEEQLISKSAASNSPEHGSVIEVALELENKEEETTVSIQGCNKLKLEAKTLEPIQHNELLVSNSDLADVEDENTSKSQPATPDQLTQLAATTTTSEEEGVMRMKTEAVETQLVHSEELASEPTEIISPLTAQPSTSTTGEKYPEFENNLETFEDLSDDCVVADFLNYDIDDDSDEHSVDSDEDSDEDSDADIIIAHENAYSSICVSEPITSEIMDGLKKRELLYEKLPEQVDHTPIRLEDVGAQNKLHEVVTPLELEDVFPSSEEGSPSSISMVEANHATKDPQIQVKIPPTVSKDVDVTVHDNELEELEESQEANGIPVAEEYTSPFDFIEDGPDSDENNQPFEDFEMINDEKSEVVSELIKVYEIDRLIVGDEGLETHDDAEVMSETKDIDHIPKDRSDLLEAVYGKVEDDLIHTKENIQELTEKVTPVISEEVSSAESYNNDDTEIEELGSDNTTRNSEEYASPFDFIEDVSELDEGEDSLESTEVTNHTISSTTERQLETTAESTFPTVDEICTNSFDEEPVLKQPLTKKKSHPALRIITGKSLESLENKSPFAQANFRACSSPLNKPLPPLPGATHKKTSLKSQHNSITSLEFAERANALAIRFNNHTDNLVKLSNHFSLEAIGKVLQSLKICFQLVPLILNRDESIVEAKKKFAVSVSHLKNLQEVLVQFECYRAIVRTDLELVPKLDSFTDKLMRCDDSSWLHEFDKLIVAEEQFSMLALVGICELASLYISVEEITNQIESAIRRTPWSTNNILREFVAEYDLLASTMETLDDYFQNLEVNVFISELKSKLEHIKGQQSKTWSPPDSSRRDQRNLAKTSFTKSSSDFSIYNSDQSAASLLFDKI